MKEVVDELYVLPDRIQVFVVTGAPTHVIEIICNETDDFLFSLLKLASNIPLLPGIFTHSKLRIAQRLFCC